MTVDTHFLVLQSWTALSALLTNTHSLEISRSSISELGLGIHVSPSLLTPSSITPLALQIVVPCRPNVVILSLPSVLGQLLYLAHAINPYEIWLGLLDGGFRVWGNTPWDEKSREVGETFVKKMMVFDGFQGVRNNELLEDAARRNCIDLAQGVTGGENTLMSIETDAK